MLLITGLDIWVTTLHRYVHVNFAEELAGPISVYIIKWHSENMTSIQGQGVPEQVPRYAGENPHSYSEHLISPSHRNRRS
jgi:hypothetical protein